MNGEKIFYERKNQGSNTYRLTVYEDSDGLYTVHYEHYVKVPASSPGAKNVKKLAHEWSYEYTSLSDFNELGKPKFAPYQELTKRLLTFIAQNDENF